MKINQPVADPLYGPFLIRVSIGLYFLKAGLVKLDNIQAFIEGVHKFKVLPEHLATLYGTLLPYMEVAVGVFLIIGLWSTLSGLLGSLMLISFIYALGIYPHQGSEVFNKDFIFLAGTLSLMCTGAGAFSVDRFRKNG